MSRKVTHHRTLPKPSNSWSFFLFIPSANIIHILKVIFRAFNLQEQWHMSLRAHRYSSPSCFSLTWIILWHIGAWAQAQRTFCRFVFPTVIRGLGISSVSEQRWGIVKPFCTFPKGSPKSSCHGECAFSSYFCHNPPKAILTTLQNWLASSLGTWCSYTSNAPLWVFG